MTTFEGGRSSTYEKTGGPFFESKRKLRGVTSEDVLHWTENLILPHQPFGEITDNFWALYGLDGVVGSLGLNYELPAFGPTPVLTRLKEQGLLDENIMGLYLGELQGNTSASDVSASGELTIGGLNTNRYKGRHGLHWQNTVHPGRWAVGLSKILVDWEFQKPKTMPEEIIIELESDYTLRKANNNTPRTHVIHVDRHTDDPDVLKPVPIYPDPDSLYMSLPSKHARELNRVLGIPATSENAYGISGCSQFDWGELPHVGFLISGTIYWLEPEDYLLRNARHLPDKCYGMIDGHGSQGLEEDTDEGAILGIMFLVKFFSAFDFENHRVGFALAA